jgi:hypothetical protein
MVSLTTESLRKLNTKIMEELGDVEGLERVKRHSLNLSMEAVGKGLSENQFSIRLSNVPDSSPVQWPTANYCPALSKGSESIVKRTIARLIFFEPWVWYCKGNQSKMLNNILNKIPPELGVTNHSGTFHRIMQSTGLLSLIHQVTALFNPGKKIGTRRKRRGDRGSAVKRVGSTHTATTPHPPNSSPDATSPSESCVSTLSLPETSSRVPSQTIRSSVKAGEADSESFNVAVITHANEAAHGAVNEPRRVKRKNPSPCHTVKRTKCDPIVTLLNAAKIVHNSA